MEPSGPPLMVGLIGSKIMGITLSVGSVESPLVLVLALPHGMVNGTLLLDECVMVMEEPCWRIWCECVFEHE